MLRHLRVMLDMGADVEGSPAALQLERQLPLYFEVSSGWSIGVSLVRCSARNGGCVA